MKKLLSLSICLMLVFSSIPAFALSYDDLLGKATTYSESDDYEKAFACYELAVRMEPKKTNAYIAASNLYYKIGQLTAAMESADTALSIDPTLIDAWLMKCRIDLANNDVAAFDSDAIYAEICGVDLIPYAAHIGVMYAKAGFFDKAAQQFSLFPIESMDEMQKEIYRRTLISLGHRDQAEAMGLLADNMRDKKLDTAFDANSLVLVEHHVIPKALSVSDFEISDELIEILKQTETTDDIKASLSEALLDAEIDLLSLSPAGNSGILSIGGTGISVYNGKYHILYPSSKRGVEDTYSNLEKYYKLYISGRIVQLLGSEGVEYSSDGRYAAIFNTRISIEQMNFVFDPIIIDLSSGEIILTAAYPSKLKPGTYNDAGVVTTATFSSDGRYFYYILYGSFENGHIRLYRYDLFENTTELCMESGERIYYPHLLEISDGSFIILNDSSNRSDITGIVNLIYKNSLWDSKLFSHALPLLYFYPNRLSYSANSGYAVMTGRSLSSDACSFQVFRPDDGFEGMNRYICITKDTNEIITLTPKDFQSSFETDTKESAEKTEETTAGFLSITYPYQIILNAIMSPDGNYLLLNTYSNSLIETSRHLFLLRLDDLTMKEISGINPEEILAGSMGARYAINIEWNCDTLIIGTKNGIKTYQFK